MSDLTCREVTDSAPGFALDILEPAARAQVAAHLIRCPDCRETVTEMQDSAARLLDLGAPWDEPEWPEWPVDPELPAVHPARRRLRVIVTLATAALLLVGTTFGPELEQAATTPGKPVSSATLLAGEQPVGVVRIYGGKSPAIDIEVSGLRGQSSLSVVVVTSDGQARRVGSLRLSGGRGAWLGADPLTPAAIGGVALVDGSGDNVASAGVL